MFNAISGISGISGVANNSELGFGGLNNFSEELKKSFENIMPNEEDIKKGDFSKIIKDQNIGDVDLSVIYDTFELQDNFNENVIQGWKIKNLDWWMAIDDEIMEVLNSVNWKWWKNAKNLKEVGTKVDMDNVEVEMVDLFHFLLSIGLEKKKENFMVGMLFTATKFNKKFNPQEIIKKVRYEMKLFAQLEVFEMVFLKWLEVWFGMGKDLNYLLKSYRIKNALNIVRQKFGYKNGTYEKIWDKENNLEDNVIAWKLAENLELNKEFFDKIIEELSKYYLTNVKSF